MCWSANDLQIGTKKINVISERISTSKVSRILMAASPNLLCFNIICHISIIINTTPPITSPWNAKQNKGSYFSHYTVCSKLDNDPNRISWRWSLQWEGCLQTDLTCTVTLRKKNLLNYRAESINFLASNFQLHFVFAQNYLISCLQPKIYSQTMAIFLPISVIIFWNDLPSKRHLVSFGSNDWQKQPKLQHRIVMFSPYKYVKLTSSMYTPPGYKCQMKFFRGEWCNSPVLTLFYILILKCVYTMCYFAITLNYWDNPLTGNRVLQKQQKQNNVNP